MRVCVLDKKIVGHREWWRKKIWIANHLNGIKAKMKIKKEIA